jgi:hypothetical protein
MARVLDLWPMPVAMSAFEQGPSARTAIIRACTESMIHSDPDSDPDSDQALAELSMWRPSGATMFKLATFLKNMALLKTGLPDQKNFRSVRMAPLYDAVTTRVFPRLEKDRMALKVNGKDERLHRGDFKKLAATMGLRASDADAAIDNMVNAMRVAIQAISVSALPACGKQGATIIARMIEICHSRIELFE